MSTPSTPNSPNSPNTPHNPQRAVSGHNGTPHPAAVHELREQIAEDRRALTETVSALQAEIDVKQLAHEKVTDVEIAVADLASRAGRAAGSVVRSGRWVATMTADRVRNAVPQPVRTQAERAGGLLRPPARLVAAGSAALMAGIAALWWRGGRKQHHACRR